MLLLLKDSGLRDATHSVLTYEAQQFIEHYEKDPNTPLPRSHSLQGFIGAETLPKHITDIFPLDQRDSWHKRKAGIYYHRSKEQKQHSHHHLLIEALPNSSKELYMYYHISTNRYDNKNIWKNVKQVTLLGFVLVIVMLLILRNFINRALNPISSLSQWINRLSDKAKPEPLPSNITNDEIGQLAKNLFDALQRIGSHNEKERAFLRNASHELRTPIAIIRNTMDVIELKNKPPANPEIDRLLLRIRRASDTMKAVTEAILWLAIEDYVAPQQTTTDLQKLLSQVITENQSLLGNTTTSLNIDIVKLGSINVENALIHITLDNLIRNAFQHCSGGEIKVCAASANRIEISNRRYDLSETEQGDDGSAVKTGGFGLGLALVQKIAEKKGWTFEFKIEDEHATAILKF
ncbi:MAG: signal transduction histidine kinase [Lentisphaeria bacterium]|jgi:signal transduction histidine kinase